MEFVEKMIGAVVLSLEAVNPPKKTPVVLPTQFVVSSSGLAAINEIASRYCARLLRYSFNTSRA